MKVKLTIFLVVLVVAFALLPLCSEVLFQENEPTDEAILGFGLLVLMGLLVATFLFGYLLHQIHFVYIHESGVGLLLGMYLYKNNIITIFKPRSDKQIFFVILIIRFTIKAVKIT